ncbi:MAG: zinc ABC transporter substrate-binding protein [Spirochaetales bacterium]|nr:zinc ABC transporter substrate-binding protein [Spirochaetales bacterium]MBP7263130.1 zinc ABC transporter substrate-binding protein [Spirochaetia bacterium]
MKSPRAAVAAAMFALIVLGGSCTKAAPDDTFRVAVSIEPQRYFLDRVTGGTVPAVVLAGQGANPHNYEPSPRQLAELGSASVWFVTGIQFEDALIPRVRELYPDLVIIDASAEAPKRLMGDHDHDDADDHDDGDEDDHGAQAPGARDLLVDPHTWLGRAGALAQARAMRDALAGMDAGNRSSYEAKYDAFESEVNAVYQRLAVELAPARGRAVFVYHPAFGYFLDDFGIEQVAVETGGKEPTQRTLAELVERAKAEGAKTVFVQKQFPAAAATALAQALGGTVVELDDLAYDWMAVVTGMGSAIAEALK